MPRPQRIQYENAFYHVMNRGRGRQHIFHGDDYYQAFLTTLEEVHSRFDAIIHAYCLMGNHYHLLIETPRANLDRIMRHINGVYTQRYNRLKQTDGPLFRGRYKAILVDKDNYLLQLSRYIHRNPVETRKPLVTSLADYRWSSYPAYINQAKREPWLYQAHTYQMLGHHQKYKGYQRYVEAGVNEEIKSLYSKGTTASVIGDAGFKEYIAKQKDSLKVNVELATILNERSSGEAIVHAVAKAFKVTESEITKRKHGRREANLPRKVAIYCCQYYGDMSLKDIAKLFGLTAIGSLSPALQDIKDKVSSGALAKEMKLIQAYLNINK